MWRWLLGGLAVVVVAVVVLVASGGSDDSAGHHAGGTDDAVEADLSALQRFADSGGGTRASGTRGDRATGAYLAERLKKAGYRVTVDPFTVPFYEERRPPRVAIDGKRLRAIRTLQFSPSGHATGRIRAVGLGCSPSDFAGFQAGEIALIRRGDCFFFQKAAFARRADAVAALMVNDGPKPTPGSLFRFGRGIPVVGLGRDAGAGLAGHRALVDVSASAGRRKTSNVIGEIGPADATRVVMAGGHRALVDVRASAGRRQTSNVIGEIGPADASRVVMAGGHRDSVPAGPGMNDDGSGVVALLAMVDRFPAGRLPPRTALRIAFWGGEELGLLGSRRYVNRLSPSERQRIAAYLNLDMVASPGAKVAVYDSQNRIEATYRRHLPLKAPQVRLIGDSDHASFEARSIPAGGIFTGLDDCYHQPCDTIKNVDRKVLATSISATEGTLVDLLAR